MADLAKVVAAQLARYGQPCVVRWSAKGTGSLAIPAQQVTSSIRIKLRSFVNASGALASVIEGMMPPTDRNLQSATITVGTRTYTVASNIEKIYQGKIIVQTVTLV